MGWKYEVCALVENDYGGYRLIEVYQGEWVVVAVYFLVRSKVKGAGYVKFEWR